MNSKYIMKFLSFIFILFFSIGMLRADTLDHQLFIRELNNSNNLVYQATLEKYNAYLADHPNDISVHIEKCKFIQLAQYDEEEEYNPNQEAFDSCAAALVKQFPSHPKVFLFQISYLWGDELESVFEKAESTIEDHPEEWSDTQLGTLYKNMSSHYDIEQNYPKALIYIDKAIARDTTYKTSIDYARILIESDRRPEALEVLKAGEDTTKITWDLSSKADLYLELKEYDNALALYNRIDQIDSTYNNNEKIAHTLEGTGEYLSARKYLVADTSKTYGKENARQRLFLHDLKYQSGAQCLSSYNAYRDLGYSIDPVGIYRLRLSFSHPFEPWQFRDILGLIALKATLLLLMVIPFIWILPLYFIGHYMNFISGKKAYISLWGLKAFWFVSAGFLIASFVATWIEPGYLYSLVNSSHSYEISQVQEGWVSILFVILFAIVGVATLYGINRKVLISNQWTIKKCILQGVGIFLLFKLIVGFYAVILIRDFGITVEDLSGMLSHFLASRKDIEAMIAAGGIGVAFILLCLVVPVYEEIVFRGVFLDAGQRYLNFKSANVIQAIFFAAMHMNLYLFPAFFLFGIFTGVMRRKSGGLLAGIVFHSINNILAITVLLMRR